MKNPITYEVPKLIFDECMIISDNQNKTFKRLTKGVDVAFSEVSIETHLRFLNIFNTYNLHQEAFKSNSGFGILSLLALSNNWSMGHIAYLFVADPLMK